MLLKFFQAIEIKEAVAYSLLNNLVSFLRGPLAALLISYYFTPTVQGYYFTFNTLLALQVFVELGLGNVVQQFASHEWAHLRMGVTGQIEGDPSALSRLGSIARFSFRWFFYAAILLTFGLGVLGFVFFQGSDSGEVAWHWPWVAISVLTGASVFFVPFWSLLDGCNQVNALYKFRFVSNALTILPLLGGIILGANLWVPAISSGSMVVLSIIFLKRYRRFFESMLPSMPGKPIVNWKTEVLPLQVRVAVTWMSGYFAFSLFTPILFKYEGPVTAGQFGMTWSLVGLIYTLANSWLLPRTPQFGILIARGDYRQLDTLFWKLVKILFLVSLSAGLCLYFGLYFASFLKIGFLDEILGRLLPLEVILYLVAGQVFAAAVMPFYAYLRMHRKEPFVWLSLLNGLALLPVTVFFAKFYSVKEVTMGHLGIIVLNTLFVVIIWHSFRENIRARATISPEG
jgi:O-antigen/teichoic acid export membrane protein